MIRFKLPPNLRSASISLYFALCACFVAIYLIPGNIFYIYCFANENFIHCIFALLLISSLVVIFAIWPEAKRSLQKFKVEHSTQNETKRIFLVGSALKLKSKITERMEIVPTEKNEFSPTKHHVMDMSRVSSEDFLAPTIFSAMLETETQPTPNFTLKSDEEILLSIDLGKIRPYQLESLLADDMSRAVDIRRQHFASKLCKNQSINGVPYKNYDYSLVANACCENVVGFVPVPLGYAGPITVDGEEFFVPMATTEGALVASTNRGCQAISSSGGVKTIIEDKGMTRAPVFEFDSLEECGKFKKWLQKVENYRTIKQRFDGTSRYVRLKKIEPQLVDRQVHVRFSATTGDAMGMNMVSKATEAVARMLKEELFSHTSMRIVSLSGNFCADKKSAAVNWISGRGKYVIAEATISAQVVSKVLKTTIPSMVHLDMVKNHVGSELAGASGGFNAHCANIVASVFLACGQDVAQTVSSSQCLTVLNETENGDLRISCTMPCLEVGTIGGGTILPAQNACLQALRCAGGHPSDPGANARRLARVICATVVAGELSLMAALTTGDLVSSHMKHNRSALSLDAVLAKLQIREKSAHHKSDSTDYCSLNLRKLADKAASTASLLQPETCSTVLT